MTTNELIRIWNMNDRSSQSDQIFELISEVLTKRNSSIPGRTKFQTKSVNFPTDSNASVKMVSPTKSEIIFPRDGYIRLGQFKFNNEEEIKDYLAETFLTDNEFSRFKGGTIRRSGKYQRIDEKGNPIFTFGDPILDLITDEEGITYISGKIHHIKLGHTAARRGGITSIDLKTDIDHIRKYQLAHSVSGNEGFTLIERNDKVTTIAKSNPEIWFYEEGTDNSMRFRTFKHNYWKYHSIGCEIETWGGSDAHFSFASITSWYGRIDLGSLCSFLKADSDSDANDDFVDEYEWGVNAYPADGVQSYCSANWRNMEKTGTVYETCEKFGGQE